jgi:outer membrane protein OmpA-like peptidoglycan-associated protein
MKKRLPLFGALLLFIPIISLSQLRIGITGGPQKASVTESNNISGWDSTTKPYYSGRGGFHFGVQVEIPVGASQKWFLQPALIYQPKGRKFTKFYDSAAASISDTLSYSNNFFANYIEIPFNLTYKLPLGKKSRFIISAGPYAGFFYNGKSTSETRSYISNKFLKNENDLEVGNAVNKAKTFDFGLNARAGFEIGNVYLTGFMSRGLGNFYTAQYEGEFHHKVAGASLGFWLNKAPVVTKKPSDKDKDGVPDQDDQCPTEPGTALMNGCPDTDADGISDKDDQCPNLRGTLKYKGCPVPDTDKDGVNDEQDSCINEAGIAKYNGCPIPDTDKDGFNDEQDKCPEEAGVNEFNGCPVPDTDGDSVNDKEDKCITEPGTVSNNGCPEIKEEIVEQVNLAARNIFFKIASGELTTDSYPALDEIAEVMTRNPSFKLEIEGHTDNTGTPTFNRTLSQKRADAVKIYLEKKGIEAERLASTGYGQDQPIADNKTRQGRAQNRRVVLKLVQN